MTYITTTELQSYITRLGLSTPTTSLQVLVERASEYLTATYYGNLIGDVKVSGQELLFPRVDIDGVDIDETQMKKAVCVLSLKADTMELFEDISKRVVEETIDVITVKYDTNSSQKTQFSEVNSLMRPYLISSGTSLKVVRV